MRRARAAYGAVAVAILGTMASLPQEAFAQSQIGPGGVASSIRPIVPTVGSPSPGASPLASVDALPGTGAAASVPPGPSLAPSTSPNPEVTRPPDASPIPSPSGSPANKVKVRADRMINERAKGTTVFRGNVHVDYGPTTIDAEELGVDSRTKTIFTDARFTLSQPDEKDKTKRQIVTGTGLRYNYETKEATLRSANVSTPAEYPGQTIYVRAKDLHGWGEGRWDAGDAVFTTCEELLQEQVPHYHVEARLMQYYAGDKVVSWGNKIFINGRYMFWLPVMVVPLKKEPNDLNVGRNEVEGFYLRSSYAYQLPTLNNGYWLNSGKLLGNLFEKKPPGLGVEHQATWGYDAATYGFFYGLLQPDRANFIPYGATGLTSTDEDNFVKRGQTLFGLSNGFFSDRQWGVEHKHRLFGDLELGGRYEDHNLYDPLSQNYRNNRQSARFDLKDKVDFFGLNYDFGYDGTKNRGQQATNPDPRSEMTLSQSNSDRLRGNMGFNAANTDFRLSSQFDRSQQNTRRVNVKADPSAAPYRLQQAAPEVLEYEAKDEPGAAQTNITNTFTASTRWNNDTNSSVNVPYRINYREPAPPTPLPSGSTATPAPTPTPSPWDQQVEPQVDVTSRLKGIGTLQLQAQKFLDLTQQLPSPAPSPGATMTPTPTASDQINAEQERIRRYGKFDKLPELTLTSEPFFADLQPFTLKAGYGRFFEYSSFKLPESRLGQYIDPNFPGEYINRFNPEATLGSKAHPIGFRSKLDFGGSGYRQFFYSTSDAQYSIDQRIRLTTAWTKEAQTNLTYTNNITPDKKELLAQGGEPALLFSNNSPFNQDRLSLSKQKRLQATFDVANDPWLRYALRGGYDYINKKYENFQSDVTWRTAVLGMPLGMQLNGQYEPLQEEKDMGGLRLEKKTLNVRYLPQIPTYGIAGRWLPVTGTVTLRSTPDLYGGAFGASKILPGWQFDSQMGYDFEKGLWQSVVNRLYITLGDNWTNHVQLMIGGFYDTSPTDPALRTYKVSTFGITKDLHDFVLSFQFDRLMSFYSLSLTMVAFPSQPLNFTSNTFDRRTGAGGAAGVGGLGY